MRSIIYNSRSLRILILIQFSGKKPHTCSQSGKSFALACNLRAHLRTHADVAQAQSSGRNEDKSAVNPSLTAAEASPSAVLAPSDSASSIFWQNFQQHLAKNILVNRVHHLGLLSSLNYSIQWSITRVLIFCFFNDEYIIFLWVKESGHCVRV